MRTYETIFIIHPDVAADAYTEVVDKYKGILSDLDAEMIAVEEWGNRKLAYLVQKQKRGSFVLFAYNGKPDGIRELERRFRIDDKIIKFMTVLLEEGYKPSGFVSTAPAATTEAATAATAEPVKETAPAATAEPAKETAPAATAESTPAVAPTEEAAPAPAEQPAADEAPVKKTEE